MHAPIPVETSARGELRRIFGLAWPVSLSQAGTMSMAVVDTIVVGQLGAQPLAALSAANLWIYGITIPAAFLLSGVDPIVSQAFGAGDRRAAGLALVRGLALAALLSLPVVALHLLASPALRLLGQPAEILADAGRFSAIVGFSAPMFLAYSVLKSYLQGQGLMRPATVAVVGANIVNLVLNVGLVYGRFGLPALGLLGSAIATSFSRFAMVGGLLVLAWPSFRAGWPAGPGRLGARPLGRLLALGVPGSAQISMEVWAFQGASLMMGWLGPVPLAAHAVLLNLSSFSFMVPLGISVAASTRVGNLVGAGATWGRAAWAAVALGAGIMVFFAALFFGIPTQIAALYSSDPAVVLMAASLLPVVAAFQIFDGTQVVAAGALRGAADLRVPALVYGLGYWAFGLPIGYGLAFHAGWGARGVWTGVALGVGAVAVLLVARLRRTIRLGATRLSGEPQDSASPTGDEA